MTQDEIIRMAREAGIPEWWGDFDEATDEFIEHLERFAALVAAHAKSKQIQNAYQQGCEDMRKRMEKRMYSLESQLQLCQTAVLAEREACADLCYKDKENNIVMTHGTGKRLDMLCAAAIRSRCSQGSRSENDA